MSTQTAPAAPKAFDEASCARCGSEVVERVADAAGVGVFLRCRVVGCGHVLSLIALRGVAASMGTDPAHRVLSKLWTLAGQTPPREPARVVQLHVGRVSDDGATVEWTIETTLSGALS